MLLSFAFNRLLAKDIDGRIFLEVAARRADHFRVHAKELPHYRFVDLYQAAEYFCQSHGEAAKVESEHGEDLNSILHGKKQRWVSRRIKRSTNAAWPVGPNQEVYFPIDNFWLCRVPPVMQRCRLIVRVRYDALREKAILEVASPEPGASEACVAAIIERSAEASVYRNKVLELAFESGTKDEYGDIERPDRLRVLFKSHEPVEDDDIVIDDEVRQTLWRNIVDLHVRRDVLKAHHVPVRRGILLYGPPGTGKTFACRYLCGKLPNTTRIIVTGTALLHVSSIFNLARMLQPSLVFLEDVDLVFGSREVNMYSSVLGELLDQMDGLRPYEEVGFVLTTNAIERMEAAIKDRPGRISQCIYFGPPRAELRKRYLMRYLQQYAHFKLDVDELVALSKGATQAFLKEWVHRSVQIASERLETEREELQLTNEDFREAVREIKRFSEGSTGRIIGFHESSPTSS